MSQIQNYYQKEAKLTEDQRNEIKSLLDQFSDSAKIEDERMNKNKEGKCCDNKQNKNSKILRRAPLTAADRRHYCLLWKPEDQSQEMIGQPPNKQASVIKNRPFQAISFQKKWLNQKEISYDTEIALKTPLLMEPMKH